MTRLGVAVAMIAAATLAMSSVAAAQDGDIPSVSVRPADTGPNDPNQGGWFVLELNPGETGTTRARVVNPAHVAQDVSFALRDLVFGSDGTPEVREEGQTGVGAWGEVSPERLRMAAGEARVVEFSITAPNNAEPGDHVGAFVATTANQQGVFTVARRIATRVYVTVPGEARRSFVIEDVQRRLDSRLWPGELVVQTMLRNDGRIRLRPEVSVAEQAAGGPELLLAQSVEQYVASVPVAWYGGLVRLPVEARAEGGLVRRVTPTMIVVPWGLLIILALLAAAGYLGRRWWQQRGSATAELRADIQRLERIVTQQVATAAPADAEVAAAEEPDEEAMLKAAWKRAQRSGDGAAMARVALGLHALAGGAKTYIVEAMEHHDGKHRAALELALTDYEQPKPKPKPAKKAAKKAAPKKKAAPRKPAGSAGHKTAKRAPAKPKKKG